LCKFKVKLNKGQQDMLDIAKVSRQNIIAEQGKDIFVKPIFLWLQKEEECELNVLGEDEKKTIFNKR